MKGGSQGRNWGPITSSVRFCFDPVITTVGQAIDHLISTSLFALLPYFSFLIRGKTILKGGGSYSIHKYPIFLFQMKFNQIIINKSITVYLYAGGCGHVADFSFLHNSDIVVVLQRTIYILLNILLIFKAISSIPKNIIFMANDNMGQITTR